MEITVNGKVEKAFYKFIEKVMEENGIECVGKAGKAKYMAICEALIDNWEDGYTSVIEESAPNWEEYDEVPQEIIVNLE